MKNKKGSIIAITVFFVVLILILIVGFIAAISTGLITWTSAQITPIIRDIGNVEGVANFTAAADASVVPANNFIQALPWVVAFAYMAMLIFSIFFAVTMTDNPHPFLIGVYFFFVLLLIFASIIMSNMYQDIYNGTDIVATQLQSQQTLSFMILHSPFILALIAVITGIFMFARPGGSEGGYGV